MAEIAIKAQGVGHISLDELIPMQGNLKTLSDENFAKLHDLIITKGFDSPVQVWKDSEGKHRLLDGHQHRLVLLKLREEGYTIPPIPADIILADSYKDAKERLLTKVSVYGSVNKEGLDEFINEPEALIDSDFEELLDIPGINLDEDKEEDKPQREPKEITCPSCGNKFYP